MGCRLRLRMQRPAARGALRCSSPWPRRGTRYAPCGRCAQTTAPKVLTKRAGARGPRALRSSALHRRRNRQPTHGLATDCGVRCTTLLCGSGRMRNRRAAFGCSQLESLQQSPPRMAGGRIREVKEESAPFMARSGDTSGCARPSSSARGNQRAGDSGAVVALVGAVGGVVDADVHGLLRDNPRTMHSRPCGVNPWSHAPRVARSPAAARTPRRSTTLLAVAPDPTPSQRCSIAPSSRC